jgi:outer membrane receptor protein involved in Fe transport
MQHLPHVLICLSILPQAHDRRNAASGIPFQLSAAEKPAYTMQESYLVQTNLLFSRRSIATATVVVSLLTAHPSSAQQGAPPPADTTKVTPLTMVTITATRSPKTVFNTASPVLVVDSSRIHATLANGVAEVLRESPGVDITGSGANQGRPIIRGQRGQRILLLEDGIRLNNTRRQQDFGELPALVSPDLLERVEVVRGPASVLYGTDAIGGVINLITTEPTYGIGTTVRGHASYQYSTNDRQQRPSGAVVGNVGRLGFAAAASYRNAKAYEAAAGTFGKITLVDETRVMDTGVRDESEAIQAGYGLSEHQSVSIKFSRYYARDAGFGFVENSALGAVNQPTIQIRYPAQTYEKLRVEYRANALVLPFADRAQLTGYTSSNERTLTLGVFVPFGPGTPPGAGVRVDSRNFTDIATIGLRGEVAKTIGKQVLTYGVDFFRDRSNNTDSSVTNVIGFGPPHPQINDTATTPNAAFRSVGVFAQGDLTLTKRVSAVLGTRWQSVRANTRATPRVITPLADASDRTVVGAANLLYRLTSNVNLVGSVGRAFRSPNLIERFFKGATPEGSGYQLPNLELKPERSLDVDLGIKMGGGHLYAEAFVFRNDVTDGIRISPTGTKVGPFMAFQNVNVDKIRDKGIEVLAQAGLGRSFTLGGSYTHFSSKNVLEPENPVGDTYSSKLTGSVGWRAPSGRFWSEYAVRMNGERKDVELGTSRVGPILPSFTVHSLRGGARLFTTRSLSNSVTVVVNNLTNVLYAEFSNASFFRPEPKRTLAVSWTSSF